MIAGDERRRPGQFRRRLPIGLVNVTDRRQLDAADLEKFVHQRPTTTTVPDDANSNRFIRGVAECPPTSHSPAKRACQHPHEKSASTVRHQNLSPHVHFLSTQTKVVDFAQAMILSRVFSFFHHKFTRSDPAGIASAYAP